MALSTQYVQEYQEAVSAYMKGGYKEAAAITDQLVEGYPSDPNLRLLRGHVYCCLQQYGIAREQYQMVLGLTSDPELLECANNSLIDTEQFSSGQETNNLKVSSTDLDATYIATGSLEDAAARGIHAPEKEGSETDFELGKTGPSRFDAKDQRKDPEIESGFINPFGGEVDALKGKESPSSLETDPFSSKPASVETSNWPKANMPDSAIEERTSFVKGAPPGSNATPELAIARESFAFGRASSTSKHESVAEDELSGNDLVEETFVHDTDRDFDQMIGAAEVQSDLDFSDDLGAPPDFSLATNFGGYSSHEGEPALDSARIDPDDDTSLSLDKPDGSAIGSHREEQGISGLPSSSSLPVNPKKADSTPRANRGIFASFENASFKAKQLIMVGVAGAISTVVVGAVSQLSTSTSQQDSTTLSQLTKTGLVAIVAGVASGATTFVLVQVTAKQIKRATADLQTQFDAVAVGNLGATATVHARDELGQLATSFNQMTRTVYTMTSEAQRRVEEQEKAKEELQRQVIRLLDDVEGVARGDLTVQAEVTADVLGAVADSFNLTIQNLQEIVQQVKVAAGQVGKGAAENETFARGLSDDALRQAEELAVTLNSVQMLTNSIQRVAEDAREADKVARSASSAALKGGEAVERTLTGILQIRGTVAETTRKVKRLAESSQEISKIVGLISQIASRTNLLALNASIEAARAGESGRGFAIVADEVRQLADRAAKASREIEQLVLQIQGETGSVMTAMEEGTQQVIEGTHRAEQAKQSLEDIIQVSNQINTLVGSITTATVEQTETSRAMAQVMQSVELTAQETSQEAQHVSVSLQHLVGVAQELQASVERFKLESAEVD